MGGNNKYPVYYLCNNTKGTPLYVAPITYVHTAKKRNFL